MNIQVPTFHDTNTTLPPTIHMDAMGFGMGSCCLQVTFQAESVQESRVLYDQLVVIAPLVVRRACSPSLVDGDDGLLTYLSRHAVRHRHAVDGDQPVRRRPHSRRARRRSRHVHRSLCSHIASRRVATTRWTSSSTPTPSTTCTTTWRYPTTRRATTCSSRRASTPCWRSTWHISSSATRW